MYDFDPIISPYNGHMLRNLSKYYLLICCKQGSSTHFCHFLATAFVTDVLAGSNPMHWAQKRKASIAGGLTIQWWAMRDVRVRPAPPAPRFAAPLLACCAGKRLRVSSAPHPGFFFFFFFGGFVLRWKTLARFLSSAPRFFFFFFFWRVRTPCAGPKKERPP